jgi:lipopolysaccharide export LptBFGC system permease protein LptF
VYPDHQKSAPSWQHYCVRTSTVLILVVMAVLMIGLDAGILLRARRLQARRILLLPVLMLAAYLWIWASAGHVAWLYAPGGAVIVVWIAVSTVAAYRSRHH